MAEQPLAGRVFVLLDTGSSLASAEVAKGLAEAGAAVVTVHGERPPAGRGVLAGDPSDPLDLEAAKTMAQELFGPVDAILDLVADLPPDAAEALAEVRRRFPA